MSSDLALQFGILMPAFVAGMVVLASHIPLGRSVLAKGIIFFDLAVAQLAEFGFVLFSLLFPENDFPLASHVFATAVATLGALMLFAFRRINVELQEALIGIVFMLASTGVVLLLSQDPHGGEKIKSMMSWQILWIHWQDLLLPALVTLALPLLWRLLRKIHDELAFYPVFAIAITMSTQMIGIYLVFASLILPVLASRGDTHPNRRAFALGTAGYLIGLVCSSLYDLPSGAAISWSLALCALCYGLGRSLYRRYAEQPVMSK
ncbi:MAG TPA: hypothetical protein DD979_17700 [Gammaproteobacteria bacterium]|jgi:zinc/manganese transport system permease protein|nr:hypothetical protein [Gammaproteobacteria bacterium]